MRPLVLRAALGVGVLVAILGGRLALGSSVGSPCSDAFLCNALPARCLLDPSGGDGYCSRPCTDASDWEPGWTCTATERRDEAGSVVEVEAVCRRPGEAPALRHTLRRR